MSFRLFVYYCAVAGGWCGFVGWFLGWMIAPPGGETFFNTVLRTSIQGLFLGFSIALGLSFLDAVFNLSLRKPGQVFGRVFAGVIFGIFAGLFGSFVGGSLFYLIQQVSWMPRFMADICFVVGWTIVGMFVGMSVSSAEFLGSMLTRKDFGSAFKKLVKCFVGGLVGGLVGGFIAAAILAVARQITGTGGEHLRSPIGIGFVVIGACIGLLIGLAQIILKEAWIKVEAGFRPGREMLISKEKTSIGRAEGSDIALFGDSGVEKTHAHIVLDGGRYFLEDLQTPGGSYVNDQKVQGRMPLKSGDLIRVGKSELRFNERSKRKD
jgi:hypothetical protein